MRHPAGHPIPARLERSTLFVPAFSWPMIEKAASSAAGSICLDLEDSVAFREKIPSRTHVVRAFTKLAFRGRERIFRIKQDGTIAMEFRRTILIYRQGPALQRPTSIKHNDNDYPGASK